MGRACAAATALLLWSMLLSAQVAPPSSGKQDAGRFPPGPGRDALFKVCHDCHGPESVLAQLKTRDEWRKTLDEMAANGAVGSDEEWTAILEYLSKHYSPVRINVAPAKELETLLEIGAPVADAIVAARPIRSLDALKQVRGIDAARIEAQKDRFIF